MGVLGVWVVVWLGRGVGGWGRYAYGGVGS